MGLSAWMLSGIGGSIGGATTLILIAHSVEWLYGGQPAHPTTEGFVFIGIYGAVCGAVFGSVAGLIFSGHRQAVGFWECAGLLIVGLIVGAFGAYYMIPLHAPIPLEVD